MWRQIWDIVMFFDFYCTSFDGTVQIVTAKILFHYLWNKQGNEWCKRSKSGWVHWLGWSQISSTSKIWKWWPTTRCCMISYSSFISCKVGGCMIVLDMRLDSKVCQQNQDSLGWWKETMLICWRAYNIYITA